MVVRWLHAVAFSISSAASTHGESLAALSRASTRCVRLCNFGRVCREKAKGLRPKVTGAPSANVARQVDMHKWSLSPFVPRARLRTYE
eukprot:scaffold330500_cov59-Tisochrysis_lutea.AAC.1